MTGPRDPRRPAYTEKRLHPPSRNAGLARTMQPTQSWPQTRQAHSRGVSTAPPATSATKKRGGKVVVCFDFETMHL